ncbi:MAG: hypothetical protein M1308_09055, partial [Actinobacteria bacterium]|nr:hypothetical protein [Actinomycetota bacterium]
MIDQIAMKTIDTRFHIETLDITKSDRLILRKLAKQVYILSENEENAKKRELWYIHNSLDKTQPLIFFDPETSWRELITLRDFHCQGDLARKWEHELLMTVFRGNNIPDDKVIEPYFDIPVSYT